MRKINAATYALMLAADTAEDAERWTSQWLWYGGGVVVNVAANILQAEHYEEDPDPVLARHYAWNLVIFNR